MNFLLLLSEADTSALRVLGNQRGLSSLPPPPARLAGSFLEFIASVQHRCAPLRLNQEDSRLERQLRPAQGSPRSTPRASGDGDHMCSRAPSPHAHALCFPPTGRPAPHTQGRSLTHSLRLCSHTRREEGETHVQKVLSAQRATRLSLANRTGPRVRGGGQVGRRTLGGVGPYRFWEPGTGPSSLGALAPSWLPRGHCAQGMT